MANKQEKNPAAVALGRLGAEASHAKRTPKERSALASKMNQARWKKHQYRTDPKAVYQREYQRKRRARLKREKGEGEQ